MLPSSKLFKLLTAAIFITTSESMTRETTGAERKKHCKQLITTCLQLITKDLIEKEIKAWKNCYDEDNKKLKAE